MGSTPTRLPTNYNAGGSSMVERSFIYSSPLFNFNVAKDVPITLVGLLSSKGMEDGVQIPVNTSRH